MADKKITELTAAGALGGTEDVEVVQGGVNVKTTISAIVALGTGTEHWRGAWAGTTALPVNADNVGSAANGDIQAGDTFVFTNQVAFGGSVFPAKSIAVALQGTPTTLAHWSILAAQT